MVVIAEIEAPLQAAPVIPEPPREKTKLELLAETLRREYDEVLSIYQTIKPCEDNKKKKLIVRQRTIKFAGNDVE